MRPCGSSLYNAVYSYTWGTILESEFLNNLLLSPGNKEREAKISSECNGVYNHLIYRERNHNPAKEPAMELKHKISSVFGGHFRI